MKKIWIMSVCLLLVGCFGEKDESPVVAKVGSKRYTVNDLNNRIDQLNPQMKVLFEKKENKVRLLDQMIDEQILYQLAQKDGVQRDKLFRESLNDLKRQTLINYFIQKKVDDNVVVSDDDVAEAYKANGAQFSAHESRNLSHILVQTKQQANVVLNKINQGTSFESLAQQYSTDSSKSQGGQLGWFRKEQLVPEFANVAYKLTKNRPISGAVKTQFGYHVIRLNDVRQVPKQSLDAVSSTLRDNLLEQKKQQEKPALVSKLLEDEKSTLTIVRFVDNI